MQYNGHSNHPDYKFPVDVFYLGRDNAYWLNGNGKKSKMSRRDRYYFNHECHALIYTDGNIAVTLYECCYAFWDLRTGLVKGGTLWKPGTWKLKSYSRKKIESYVKKNNRAHNTREM